MEFTAEEKAYIYLSACSPLEHKEKEALLMLSPDAATLFEHLEDFTSGVLPPERQRRIENFAARRSELARALDKMDKKGYFAIPKSSPLYPKQLAATDDAPLVLFGSGNRELLKERIFSIVGSRRTSSEIAAFGSKVSEELSAFFVVATGLAEGGDLSALKGALKTGRAISVLPCGIDECYPAAHISYKQQTEREGLVLSESLDEKTQKFSFHARNRILAGIAEGVLILSAGEKSGALITANYCADYGRELFALPYSIGASQGVGCNKLLKQGAYLCTCTQDILDAFGILMKEKPTLPPLEDDELKILSVLAEGEELHASLIAQRAKMQLFEVTALLAGLEMKGLVIKSGGNCYKMIG